MAEHFTKLVLELAENPQVLERFKVNPDEVIASAGLSPAEKSILQSRDASLVRDAIVSDLKRAGVGTDVASGVTVVIWTHTRVRETDIAGHDLSRLSSLTRRFS